MKSKIDSSKSNSFAYRAGIFLWLIPLGFFVASSVLFFVFVSGGDPVVPLHDDLLLPAQVIDIDEPFSGIMYFNTEFYGTEFSNIIVGAIDRATSTIEVAVYSLNHPRIHDALYRAHDRGVLITLLLSEARAATHDVMFSDLPSGITRVDVAYPRGSMHHKFLMIDRGLPSATLLFGSYNFTVLQEKYDSSFLMETTRPEIINTFGEEFDRIHSNALTNSDESESVTRNPFAALITYPEGSLEIWFSPSRTGESEVRQRLLNLIHETNHTIDSMIWSLTDASVSSALLAKAKEGKTVRVLTDDFTFSQQDSVFPDMLVQQKLYNLKNLEILTDEKRARDVENTDIHSDFNPFLHHHLLVVDEQQVFFGTNNWSVNGFTNNDESIMVSDIPYLVSSFSQAFHENRDKAL